MMFALLFTLSILGQAFAGLQNVASYGGTTLKYYNQHQDFSTFAGAVVECIKKGGELVMPKYSGLNTAVAKVAQNQRAWIGGGDFKSEGSYEWNDGSSLEWANWIPGEPNDGNDGSDGNKENCMEINWKNPYTWNDYACCERLGYVCQMSGKSQPYEYSVLTVFAGETSTSYANARRTCRQRRSRLVSIDNDEQIDHLNRALDDSTLHRFWVGKRGSSEDSCSAVSWNSLHNTNCESSLSFVCEEVAPHDLTVSNEAPEVSEGSRVEIGCFASGFPVPKIAWYRGNVFVPNQECRDASSTLTIENISPSDAGVYVCRAVNEIGGRTRQMEGYSIIEVFRLD